MIGNKEPFSQSYRSKDKDRYQQSQHLPKIFAPFCRKGSRSVGQNTLGAGLPLPFSGVSAARPPSKN